MSKPDLESWPIYNGPFPKPRGDLLGACNQVEMLAEQHDHEPEYRWSLILGEHSLRCSCGVEFGNHAYLSPLAALYDVHLSQLRLEARRSSDE